MNDQAQQTAQGAHPAVGAPAAGHPGTYATHPIDPSAERGWGTITHVVPLVATVASAGTLNRMTKSFRPPSPPWVQPTPLTAIVSVSAVASRRDSSRRPDPAPNSSADSRLSRSASSIARPWRK